MSRNDLIALISDLLGGAERATAERMADALHEDHPNWDDAAAAVRAMDNTEFFDLAVECMS